MNSTEIILTVLLIVAMCINVVVSIINLIVIKHIQNLKEHVDHISEEENK